MFRLIFRTLKNQPKYNDDDTRERKRAKDGEGKEKKAQPRP